MENNGSQTKGNEGAWLFIGRSLVYPARSNEEAARKAGNRPHIVAQASSPAFCGAGRRPTPQELATLFSHGP